MVLHEVEVCFFNFFDVNRNLCVHLGLQIDDPDSHSVPSVLESHNLFLMDLWLPNLSLVSLSIHNADHDCEIFHSGTHHVPENYVPDNFVVRRGLC